MLARDLAAPFPVVSLDTDGLAAARMLTEQHLPGLLVVDENEQPYSVLPGSQVLRFLLPNYLVRDPVLARVYDEDSANQITSDLSRYCVRDVLPDEPHELPVLNGDDTTVEIAVAMARLHSPIAAVVEEGRMLGAVTTDTLLSKLLPAA